jgi:hypothetical protein
MTSRLHVCAWLFILSFFSGCFGDDLRLVPSPDAPASMEAPNPGSDSRRLTDTPEDAPWSADAGSTDTPGDAPWSADAGSTDTPGDAPWSADADSGLSEGGTPDSVIAADTNQSELGGSPHLCSDGATRSCAMEGLLGNCAKGIETCVGGAWEGCSVSAQKADRCDIPADDANCNGRANEGCACVSGDKQACGPSVVQGICKRGTQTCSNAQWGPCEGATYARPRDCTSALDNDCDGEPDNTIDLICQCNPVNGVQSCGSHPQDGVGPCRAGSQRCVAGSGNASTSWGPCTGSIGPAASDTCASGNDANCNGAPNERCTALGHACDTESDCQSGVCVQGVCCASACPRETPNTCGNDGTCDANGACRKFSGVTCGDPSCSNRSDSHEAGVCQNGGCQPGKKCDYHGCGSDSRCATTCPSGFMDTGTACIQCGGENQPCCINDSCPNAPSLICSFGTCEHCGREFEHCCAGFKCDAANRFCKRLNETDPGSCRKCGSSEFFTCCPGDLCPDGVNTCDWFASCP